MGSVDIIYLAWNRLEMTRVSFAALLANTDWSRVRKLIVYEDGSTDGTRDWLDAALVDAPVDAGLSYLGFGSPVRTMIHYLNGTPADAFVKIDNDIAVPPGWLDAMLGVMDRSPELELLGMQYGMGDDLRAVRHRGNRYGYSPCSHIGGVGLMRTEMFDRLPTMTPAGRFGFTQWQQRHDPVRGWITPDLRVPQLDLLPMEPWRSLSARYIRLGWQREWPPYDPRSHEAWDWIPDLAGVAA